MNEDDTLQNDLEYLHLRHGTPAIIFNFALVLEHLAAHEREHLASGDARYSVTKATEWELYAAKLHSLLGN